MGPVFLELTHPLKQGNDPFIGHANIEHRWCARLGAGHWRTLVTVTCPVPILQGKMSHQRLPPQGFPPRASLVVQWLRICLPMQGPRVRSLGQEGLTCRGATEPVRHNY